MHRDKAIQQAIPHVQSAFDTGKWPNFHQEQVTDFTHLEVLDRDRYFVVELVNGMGQRLPIFDSKEQRMYHWLKEHKNG